MPEICVSGADHSAIDEKGVIAQPSKAFGSTQKTEEEYGHVLHMGRNNPPEPHLRFAEQTSWLFSVFSACKEGKVVGADCLGNEGYCAETNTIRVSEDSYNGVQDLRGELSALSSIAHANVLEKDISKKVRALIGRLIGADCLAPGDGGCQMKTVINALDSMNIQGVIKGGFVDDASVARCDGGVAYVLELKREYTLKLGSHQAVGTVIDAASLFD